MEDSVIWSLIALGLALTTAVLYLLPSKSSFKNGLEVAQLYAYPIKGTRGCALKTARLGPYGVEGDRTFCLQKVHRDDGNDNPRYETMLIAYHLQLALFVASIGYENDSGGEVSVQWKGRGTEFGPRDINTEDVIRFPLKPSVQDCPTMEVNLHASTATAYDMGDKLSKWFSDRLGFEARLVYIGNGSRPVLGSMAPNSPGGLKRARLLKRIRGLVPFLAYPSERLVFNDIAHYLVVTEESNNQVSSRLDAGYTMDVTKFRPNIVLRGASAPFEEDYWGELTFEGRIRMPLTANCWRCRSITVDYNTGKTATDDRGMVWKKLNKDRRVDQGAKYSPVFGRYGYCFGDATSHTLEVGQRVAVTRINAQRTVFDWPPLTSFGVSQKK